MVSQFMLNQRKLVDDLEKNNGVPPIKSITEPNTNANVNPGLQTLNNNSGGKFFNSVKNAFYTPRLQESRKMVNEATNKGGMSAGVGMALKRFGGDALNTARDWLTPRPLRDLASGAAENIGTALSTAVTGKYDDLPQDNTGQNNDSPINYLKNGIITKGGPRDTSYTIPGQGSITVHGDSKIRDPLNKGMSGQQNSNGSYSVGNLDAQFDQGTDPEAIKRFLAPISRGATLAERGFSGNGGRGNMNNPVFMQTPKPLRELLTKENSNMGWKSRLALNKQMLVNEGGLEQQQERSSGTSTATGLNNAGRLAEQGLRNDALASNQVVNQNTARDKNILAQKKNNIGRLKARYDLLKGQEDSMLGDPTFAKRLKIASREYQRALGTGNEQAQKYLN